MMPPGDTAAQEAARKQTAERLARLERKVGQLTMLLDNEKDRQRWLLALLRRVRNGTVKPDWLIVTNESVRVVEPKEEESAGDKTEVLEKNGASGQEPPSNLELEAADALAEANPSQLRAE